MYLQEYQRWLQKATDDPDLLEELKKIEGNDEEIRDRFTLDLEFGTGGLRGVIGAGTYRMNVYTVRKATQGMANYIKKQGGAGRVAISYDSRNKSRLFSEAAAGVLAANGIHVFMYKELMPTPCLSFAVRELGCDTGIMMTASHNPAKYNGYKAYGPDGCQVANEAADTIYAEMQKTDLFDDVKTMSFDEALENGLVSYIPDEVYESYYAHVKAQSVRPGVCKGTAMKLVYTPLNGTGNVPVRRILKDVGVSHITVVPEQEFPDGNFPTCPYPNPEIREALEKGLALSRETGADLLLATDPDADRVGIAVKDEGDYRLLSGNEVGVLLTDYLCKARLENGTMPKDPILVKSIVSTCLADEVAKSYGVTPVNVLTGFKYIGEQIHKLEEKGEEDRYLFGFEESYGYLSGTYVRDKDAVVGSMLIVEMAAYYHATGTSILEQLEAIYKKFGRWLHKVDSFEFEGLAGMDKMKGIMSALRAEAPKEIAGLAVVKIEDYQTHERLDTVTGKAEKIDLPASNVLVYTLEDGASVVVRPSGTEPKIKAYYSTVGKDLAEADAKRARLAQSVNGLLGL